MRTLTVLGRRLQRKPLEALNSLSDKPPGLIPLASRPCFAALVTDPALVEIVLTDERFRKGAEALQFRAMIGDGTATSWFPARGARSYLPFADLEELRHLKRRAILLALSGRQLPSYSESIRQMTGQTFASWRTGEVFDIYAALNDLMFRIMATCLFGRQPDANVMASAHVLRQSSETVSRRLRTLLPTFDRSLGSSALWPSRGRVELRRRRAAIRQIANHLIHSPQSDPNRSDDFVSLLRVARDSSGNAFTDKQLLSSTIGLFLAGYENSASAAAWTLWHLASHPETQQQYIALSEPLKSRYLRACIRETLRLYSPIWSTARVAACEVRLGSSNIAANSVLLISPWLQGRQTSAWEEPQMFRPERFLIDATPSPGSYLPFGNGPYSCPGEQFAFQELTIVLTAILKRWRLERVPHLELPQPILGVTQRPKAGVFLRLVEANV